MKRTEVLTNAALNRALLARQWLLGRRAASELEAVAHLVGMQAQMPLAPYVGLWSRLIGYRPDGLSAAMQGRRVARLSLMRSTLHLATAADSLWLRRLVQPVHERMFDGCSYGRNVAGVDRGRLEAAAREVLADGPQTLAELGTALRRRWRTRDATSLAYAVRTWVPLVQVPPRGVWGTAGGRPACDAADRWLGRPEEGAARVEPDDLPALVLRYLGAFGPATVADVQMWSGLKQLQAVVDELRPQLVVFRAEDGRELFDLPDAPRPDAGVAAPPRFLPEFDNVLLGHADRSRVVLDRNRIFVATGNGMRPCLLVEGMARATWRIEKTRDAAELIVTPFEPIARRLRDEVVEEGGRLLGFLAPGRAHGVTIAAVASA